MTHILQLTKLALVVPLLIFLSQKGNAAASPPKVSFLQLGQFHSEEVNFRSGGEWLALFPGEGGGELRKGELVIEKVYDPIADKEGEASGKLVKFKEDKKVWSSNDDQAPIALIKGSGIKERSIIGEGKIGTELSIGAQYGVRSKERNLTVYVTGVAVDSCYDCAGPVLIRDYCVKVSSRDNHGSLFGWQSLFCYQRIEGDFQGASLEWSGDLNGDEQPDLIISGSDHYNKSETRLYLSYQGAEGEMYYEAGRITSVGC